MLLGKNVVIVKGDKDTLPAIKEYDRVYLEFGAKDAVETFSKTSEGKDLQVNGKKWEGIRPAAKVSSTPVEELLEQALANMSERFPSTNPAETPYHILLSAASYGADLWQRNQIQADIRPAKAVDRDAQVAKMVKLIMSLNPKMTVAKATAAAIAATAEE